VAIALGVDSTGRPTILRPAREAFREMRAFKIEYADAGIGGGVDNLGKKIEEIRCNISI
jgi:hypothetical protein